MSVEVGAIVEGTITGITNFGAFVDLGSGKTGLIHISEVSDVYVKDIKDFLNEGDKVKVKVLSVDGAKVGLSIKKLLPPRIEEIKSTNRATGRGDSNQDRRNIRTVSTATNFEDKLSRFIKDSDERLLDLKRHTESRRGGRGASRRG